MKRGIRFIYLFRHFNLTPVRNLDCTSSLQPAPVLLHKFTSVIIMAFHLDYTRQIPTGKNKGQGTNVLRVILHGFYKQ